MEVMEVMVIPASSQHHEFDSAMNGSIFLFFWQQDDPPGKTGVLPLENDRPGGVSLRDSWSYPGIQSSEYVAQKESLNPKLLKSWRVI